jgi:hypothetical protein
MRLGYSQRGYGYDFHYLDESRGGGVDQSKIHNISLVFTLRSVSSWTHKTPRTPPDYVAD